MLTQPRSPSTLFPEIQHGIHVVLDTGEAKASSQNARLPWEARGTASRRLELEWLESRLVPATHIWTGATSGLWSDNSNWTGGSPAGDPDRLAAAVAALSSGMRDETLAAIFVESPEYQSKWEQPVPG